MSPRGDSAAGVHTGVVFLDKEAGLTSFAAIGVVKRLLSTRRVGHTGTLDPFATGLMVVLTGSATRCARLFSDLDKRYEATFTFGTETTTDDSTGDVVLSKPIPSVAGILAGLQHFRGEIDQVPPNYSAIHVDGRRAHQIARAGRTVELESRRVTIFDIEARMASDCNVEIALHCTSGTYVRSIARDLGRLLGSAAHVSRLRRTAVGPFSVDEATSPSTLSVRDVRAVLPVIERLPGLRLYELDQEQVVLVRNGGRLMLPPDASVRQGSTALTHAGRLFAVGHGSETRFDYEMVFPEGIA